jgi:Family of unknown function (DUF6527)
MKVTIANGYASIRCPGCDMKHHTIDLKRWTFDGNMDSPTFTPSVSCKYAWGEEQHPVICHFNVTAGKIVFHGDCTHALKGQTVPMLEIEEVP